MAGADGCGVGNDIRLQTIEEAVLEPESASGFKAQLGAYGFWWLVWVWEVLCLGTLCPPFAVGYT